MPCGVKSRNPTGRISTPSATIDRPRRRAIGYEDETAFDVVGDGVVDDGAALQNYFDYCTSTGCNIKLTRGWYNTTIPLRLGTGLPDARLRVGITMGGLGDGVDQGRVGGTRIVYTGGPTTAILTIHRDIWRRFRMHDIGFVCANHGAAKYGVLQASSEMSGPLFDRITVEYCGTAFGLLEGTGVNGEFGVYTDCNFWMCDHVFYSNAGQGYIHMFRGLTGLLNAGGTYFVLDSPVNGGGLHVTDLNVTGNHYWSDGAFDAKAFIGGLLDKGTTNTTLLALPRGGTNSPIHFIGGRVEWLTRLFKGIGVVTALHMPISIKGMEITVDNDLASAMNTIKRFIDTSMRGDMINIEDTRFEGVVGTEALNVVATAPAAARVTFRHCSFVNLARVPFLDAPFPAASAAPAKGPPSGLVIEDCSYSNYGMPNPLPAIATWTAAGATLTANAAAAPNNSETAALLQEDTATTTHGASATVRLVPRARRYGFMIFAKPAARGAARDLLMQASDGAGNGVSMQVDLVTGAASGAAFGSGSVLLGTTTDLQNRYWQCNLMFRTGTGGALAAAVNLVNAGRVSYAGDGSAGVLVWDAYLYDYNAMAPLALDKCAVDYGNAVASRKPYSASALVQSGPARNLLTCPQIRAAAGGGNAVLPDRPWAMLRGGTLITIRDYSNAGYGLGSISTSRFARLIGIPPAEGIAQTLDRLDLSADPGFVSGTEDVWLLIYQIYVYSLQYGAPRFAIEDSTGRVWDERIFTGSGEKSGPQLITLVAMIPRQPSRCYPVIKIENVDRTAHTLIDLAWQMVTNGTDTSFADSTAGPASHASPWDAVMFDAKVLSRLALPYKRDYYGMGSQIAIDDLSADVYLSADDNRLTFFAGGAWRKAIADIATNDSTATAADGAAMLDAVSGVITTDVLDTPAGAYYTLTLTNSFIKATSKVLPTLDYGSNTTEVLMGTVTVTAGRAVFKVKNSHATAALNGTLKIGFLVV